MILYSTDKVVMRESLDGHESIQAYYGSFNGNYSVGSISGTITKVEYDYSDNLPGSTLSDLNVAWSDLFSGSYAQSNLYSGNDSLVGGSYADSLAGYTGNDTLYGGALEDVLYGNQGQDQIYGDAGADSIFGGQDADTMHGGDNEDLMYGNLGDDVMSGDSSSDTLFGGQGQDTLYGGDGNDLLIGNLGNDLLVGGAGSDQFDFKPGAGNDTVADFSFVSGDHIRMMVGSNYSIATNASGDAVIRLISGDELTLKGFAASQVTSDWILLV